MSAPRLDETMAKLTETREGKLALSIIAVLVRRAGGEVRLPNDKPWPVGSLECELDESTGEVVIRCEL